jgi:hypothetical protein
MITRNRREGAMDPNIMIVAGLALAMLSVPSAVRAWADARMPYVSFLAIAVAGLLGYLAFNQAGYTSWQAVPNAVYEVIKLTFFS